MKVSQFLLNSIFGFASILSLSNAAAEADHADHNHKHPSTEHAEHQHSEGEECDGHEHAEHKHAEGEECDGHDQAEHKHAEGEKCDASSTTTGEKLISVTIDDKAKKSLDMKVEKVVARPGLSEKSFYGQMEIPPHAVNTCALSAAGRVKLNVQSAQHVKKGDLLYTLDSPDILEIKAKADEDNAALARNTAELDVLLNRQKQLNEIGTKNSELDTSINFKKAERPGLEAAADNSSLKLAQALAGGELKEGTLYVKADKDGSVQSVDINRGAWGEQGATVLVLTNKGDLEFKTTAYSGDSLNPSGALLVLDSPDGKESLVLDGKIRISDQINRENQTRNVYFTPDKLPQWAYAGQVARLEINSGDDEANGYIPVPNSAVVKVGVNDVVFIQDKNSPNKFIMQKVAILTPRQGMTPVNGLHEGQTIVTKGGYELKYAIPAQEGGEKKAAGHFHADGKFHEGEH